ncbi:uncharacterized protein LOC133874025 [Alnus glutinosa]|uniref:uncharacterized protein LOC133874025 n=1 Tax=Alnus glutinosa TaxID=3517 RepID=UPI002D79E60D|nr:uncharacterized protein LOC133874025 [Alnus glutinosa]
MEGAIGGHLAVQSSRPENKKRKTDGSSPSSNPSPYVVLIRMPIFERDWKVRRNYDRWYTMKIPADAVDGTEGSISEVWAQWCLDVKSTFALVGSDLYCFRGILFNYTGLVQNNISDVRKVNISNPTDHWIHVPPLDFPRCCAHNLVVGDKLYVLNKCPFSLCWGAEVYDPMTGVWESLPEPPYRKAYHIISAALENPNRILVATLPFLDYESEDEDEDEDKHKDIFANFIMYDVQNCCWKILGSEPRKIHPKCPLGEFGKALAVGNYLYWILDKANLLAYNFESDLWLTGDLKGLNISTNKHLDAILPCLIHLEKKRFCVIHTTEIDRYTPESYVQCILFDVFHMPELKSVRISFVSTIKYKTARTTSVRDAFLMGK